MAAKKKKEAIGIVLIILGVALAFYGFTQISIINGAEDILTIVADTLIPFFGNATKPISALLIPIFEFMGGSVLAFIGLIVVII